MQTRCTSFDLNNALNALEALTQESAQLYVLIDRLNFDPLAQLINELSEEHRPLCVALNDPIFENAPLRTPLLVQLMLDLPGHQNLLTETLLIAQEEAFHIDGMRTVCGWLFSREKPETLAAHLARRQDIRYPNKRIYLRYFDPRVLPRLNEILGQKADAHLFAPVHTWCHLGRDGNWYQHDLESVETEKLIPYPNADEALAIDRIVQINQVARHLGPPPTAPHARDIDIDNALTQAMQWKLTDTDDQITYAVRSLQDGETFTQHHLLRRWIQLTLETGAPLNDVISEYRPTQAATNT
ncbi:MAG: DUF4123 domain-containing protein [Spongiibacteraceae bacterium]